MLRADLGLIILAAVFVGPALVVFGLIRYPVITICACGALAVFVLAWWIFGPDASFEQTG